MDRKLTGWGSGLLGVVIFSGSLPATRVAVADFMPLFLTASRGMIAALCGALCLLVLRQAWPGRQDLRGLAIVAAGVVIGFPLLTALALQHVTAARSVVFIGLLPLSTALFGVLRGGERPRPAFWLFSGLGAAVVAGFALWQGGGGAGRGDLLMLAAVAVCGLGYAEGGLLSRRMGGWQVICWALLMAAPVMAVLVLVSWPGQFAQVTLPGWLSLGYVGLFSMLVGFVFWYRGLALGGIAGVGQLQLLQPFLGLALAALVLKEPVAWPMVGCTGAVVLCVLGARRYA
ncbi:EamA family transporter [Pseudooceanicola sp. GBMRC 2024]|uniref:EamA family transporter n=1 Tax=Pseudooceanicola albus TaxID=2692189 RepID=A0A6L7G4A5_9RHOB|nr:MULTISPECIES: DMT family transporter [Pseudooceanicola]MXN18679.1 EamA family transporter [Pseudooceanicola albus]